MWADAAGGPWEPAGRPTSTADAEREPGRMMVDKRIPGLRETLLLYFKGSRSDTVSRHVKRAGRCLEARKACGAAGFGGFSPDAQHPGLERPSTLINSSGAPKTPERSVVSVRAL